MNPSNEYYVKEHLRLLREEIEKKVKNEELYKSLMQKLDNLEFYVLKN